MSADARPDILVLGAGVIGLTTAVVLAEAGHAVRVWAADAPQRTTSRAATGMWGSAFFGESAETIEAWALRSLNVLRVLAGEPQAGVQIRRGTLASPSGTPPPPGLFPGVELETRVPPEGYLAAASLAVPLIDMPRYLDFLAARLAAAGAVVELRTVTTLEQAAAAAPVVVNCSGVGARALVPDPGVRAVRGQQVVVENPGIEEFFMEEPSGPRWVAIHPHGDLVVLGGTHREDVWDLAPDLDEADRIVAGCVRIDPRLAAARIVEHRVGLRPARGTIRVEAEPLAGGTVVHCYGHGGSGVALSWGSAEAAAALAAQAVARLS